MTWVQVKPCEKCGIPDCLPGGEASGAADICSCDPPESCPNRRLSVPMVYVASSWRCRHQPRVVNYLRVMGLDVYDFRNPRPGDHGFAWSQIDPEWQSWSPAAFRDALEHPVAKAGYASDMDALAAASACLLVLPSGRSAHLELGWAAGAGKQTAVFAPEPTEPELMYRMVGKGRGESQPGRVSLLTNVRELAEWAMAVKPEGRRVGHGFHADFSPWPGVT